VGQTISVNLIALKNSSNDQAKFAAKAKVLASATKLNIILMSESGQAQSKALEQLGARRPLIHAATKTNYEEFAKIAKQHNAPLAVKAGSLDELAELTAKLKSLGVEELVLDSGEKPVSSKIADLVNIRRLALKKTFRALGYPAIVFSREKDPFKEALAAASYIARYAGIVVLNNNENWQVLPILTARQDIYTDPQKPVQVEAKIYEIGNVRKDSPVMVTTNFSITYYTVAGEAEASKVPCYIIACDCEGMSVLTAWAAEKFTPEKIADTIKKFGIAEKVSHKSLIIPGYVAMMSGKLEDLMPGYKIIVGPREASGIPAFLKSSAV
jgi:acetyl-CoA decarbonylase/synthase complex subunit gamma